MAKIKITDSASVTIDIEPKPGSAIDKYFKRPASLKVADASVLLGDGALVDFPVSSARVGLEVEEDIEIGSDGETELTLSAGVSSGFKIVKEGKELFDPERFEDDEDNVTVPQGSTGVCFDIEPAIGVGLETERGDLTFGFGAESEARYAYYKLFETTSAGPSFKEALSETISEFVIPGDLNDLRGMPRDSFLSAQGETRLKLLGGFSVSTNLNPLVSKDLPGGMRKLDIKPGAKFSVEMEFLVEGEMQLRAQKVSDNEIEFGLYNMDSRTIEVTVGASAGLSTKIGKTDVVEVFSKSVQGDDWFDKDFFKEGGLEPDEIKEISKAVGASVDRSLSVSIAAAFKRQKKGEEAFVYRIDLDKLAGSENLAGREAVQHALDGDFRLMPSEPDAAFEAAGVKFVKSILTDTKVKEVSLRLNLLGIYTAFSTKKVGVKVKTIYDDTTGELILTDSVTAKAISGAILPWKADEEKLRKLYYESFLMTAVYRATRTRVEGEELDSRHRYFEFHHRTRPRTMKDNLDVAVAMGFLSSQEMSKLLDHHPEFGRSTLLADVAYNDKLLRSLFLVNDEPRPAEDYEEAGKAALRMLVETDPDMDYRSKTLLGSWNEFKKAGAFPAAQQLMPHLNKVQQGVVHSDYLTIVWWAKAMRQLAATLHDLQEFYESGGSPDRKRFQKLRQKLVNRTGKVAERTRKQFGDPWGLIAMDLLANRQGKAHVRILCDAFTYDKEAASEAARA